MLLKFLRRKKKSIHFFEWPLPVAYLHNLIALISCQWMLQLVNPLKCLKLVKKGGRMLLGNAKVKWNYIQMFNL